MDTIVRDNNMLALDEIHRWGFLNIMRLELEERIILEPSASSGNERRGKICERIFDRDIQRR
jgi:hypothetical protein